MVIAIQLDKVSKKFRIPLDKQDGLKGSLISLLSGKANYREFPALKDISFSVQKGEFIGIIGPNGSGKSTLLKIIANILRPDHGKMRINGDLSPFLELGLGFQGELSGKENIYLYGTVLGMSKKEIDTKMKNILAFSELKDFMTMPLKNYSSGMHVRLAFSVAIQAKSDILLFDEVLAVGDASFQNKCYKYFKSIKGKKTVLFVSHDLNSIQQYSDRAILIQNGRVVANGATKKVIDYYSRKQSTH
ncbi:MAG: ABC transporter ATP-binding protein [Nanoarchaeota archaeon]|nr:ABC transporter ATP-binding protein [Nanoarchaeota archaeon]